MHLHLVLVTLATLELGATWMQIDACVHLCDQQLASYIPRLLPALQDCMSNACVERTSQYIQGVPYTLAKLAIWYCVLHFGY